MKETLTALTSRDRTIWDPFICQQEITDNFAGGPASLLLAYYS